jgi:diamine N-acetyltransferase
MEQIDFIICDASHIDTIQKLADKIWRKHYPSIISIEQIDFMLDKMYSSQSLLQQMQDGNVFTLLQVNSVPIGFSSVCKQADSNYFLSKLYVDTATHRKGLGKLLLDKIITDIQNGDSISLTVNRQNYQAINFYFKNGFVIDKVADFEIGNGFVMNDFVMKKKLSLH